MSELINLIYALTLKEKKEKKKKTFYFGSGSPRMKAFVNHPTRLTHLRRIKCFGAVRRGGWDLGMYVRWRRLLSESQHHRIIRFGR